MTRYSKMSVAQSVSRQSFKGFFSRGMNLIDGAKVLIICEISLHISSHLIQTATICKTRQGLVGGIVGPGYSSSGYIYGSSRRLASRLRRWARIGHWCSKCSERSGSHFLKMVDWKSSTDPLEEVTIFGVLRRVPNDPLWEVMPYCVSGGSQLTKGRGAGREWAKT